MTLDMERMKRLGLKEILEKKYSDEQAFQVDMAKKLRELTFQYLRGDLKNLVEDGPEVKELRTNLNATGTMSQFVANQSPNRAWATYLELTLLAELVGANFAVTMSGGREKPTILTAKPREDKPTIVLNNEHNTHWSAKIDGVNKNTHDDGNCGYNAFALCLASQMPQKKEVTPSPTTLEEAVGVSAARLLVQEEKKRLKASVAEAQKAEEQFESAMQRIKKDSPDQYKSIQEQIHADYLFALSLAMSDLPDEDGKTNIPVGQLSKIPTDVKYIGALAQEAKSDNDEYTGPRYR